MTLSRLPAPVGVPYEPWEREAAVLAEAAATGRRAAAWVRSLPGPPFPPPAWTWLVGDLAVAIEAAMAGLDPKDCDRMAPDGLVVDGTGGLNDYTADMLATVPNVVADAAWLTPEQQVRLLAVASAVTGAARVLADDPGSAIRHGLLARLCAALDHAVS
ncbi:hypothetical protein [Streptomyces sp. SM13]|uniref:hypothetical protein n=1 Tax=Streptomyces sp. SM13 TaxID=1983803 RepID=UPI0011B00335|nr:hypothetical protein [Streptomyces sp. SM13]